MGHALKKADVSCECHVNKFLQLQEDGDISSTGISTTKNHTIVGTLPERLAAAIRRRVGPGAPLTVKEVSYGLGVSESTVWQWMSGNRHPRGDHLINLFQFFGSGFANEVVGNPDLSILVLPRGSRIERAIQTMSDCVNQLREMGI